jgi:hypothetical protein
MLLPSHKCLTNETHDCEHHKQNTPLTNLPVGTIITIGKYCFLVLEHKSYTKEDGILHQWTMVKWDNPPEPPWYHDQFQFIVHSKEELAATVKRHDEHGGLFNSVIKSNRRQRISCTIPMDIWRKLEPLSKEERETVLTEVDRIISQEPKTCL